MGTNVPLKDLETLANSIRWTLDKQLTDIPEGGLIQGFHGKYNCIIPFNEFNPDNIIESLNNAIVVEDIGTRILWEEFGQTSGLE